MRLPLELQRFLILWAGLENNEIEGTMSYAKVCPMFRDYRPNTSWRELATRHEWTTDELRGIESVAFEMSKLALYDRRAFLVLRHYWKNGESINSVVRSYGGSKAKIKQTLRSAHAYLIRGLGYDKGEK